MGERNCATCCRKGHLESRVVLVLVLQLLQLVARGPATTARQS
jgi:hypothetical protein